jgi:hypothetical protein
MSSAIELPYLPGQGRDEVRIAKRVRRIATDERNTEQGRVAYNTWLPSRTPNLSIFPENCAHSSASMLEFRLSERGQKGLRVRIRIPNIPNYYTSEPLYNTKHESYCDSDSSQNESYAY